MGLTAILKPGGTGFVMGDITSRATEQKVEWIRQAAGERFEQLEINSFVFATKVTDHREKVAGHIAHGSILGGGNNDEFTPIVARMSGK